MIKKCENCLPHEGQDKMHGSKMRVHNPAGGTKAPVWRCTVCKVESSRREKAG